jgi:4-hydroxy-3-methylbut-2-enyl diphosphate reductase
MPHSPDTTDLPFSKDGIIRRPLGLKKEILGELESDYHSDIIHAIRENDYRMTAGQLEFRLARNFGFCYGVDKAIDMAYETRRRFPDRDIYLTTEIIHNPKVNNRLVEMGIHFLSGQYSDGSTLDDIKPSSVVLIPAFGDRIDFVEKLKKTGCILVDTTCGSVVHVWKRVEKHATEGFTAVIHGKYWHEETIATCSHVSMFDSGRYLVILNKPQAEDVCRFIRTGEGADALQEKHKEAASPEFDFTRDLERVGVANQTTMLASESMEIGNMLRDALVDRYGGDHIRDHYRAFGTICSATQENQDAVLEMMKDPPDIMLVVGGFNSSNTAHLAKIAGQYCLSWHVEDADCLISPSEIRHRPAGMENNPRLDRAWWPEKRPLRIGLTAGASTPNRVIGEVIEKLISWEGDECRIPGTFT